MPPTCLSQCNIAAGHRYAICEQLWPNYNLSHALTASLAAKVSWVQPLTSPAVVGDNVWTSSELSADVTYDVTTRFFPHFHLLQMDWLNNLHFALIWVCRILIADAQGTHWNRSRTLSLATGYYVAGHLATMSAAGCQFYQPVLINKAMYYVCMYGRWHMRTRFKSPLLFWVIFL